MSKTAVIVVGGRHNQEFMENILKTDVFDLMIAADRGLEFFYKAAMTPTHIVGDFDSVDPRILEFYEMNPEKHDQIQWTRVPSEKDDTDTELAISIAIDEGATDLLLLGATGTRLDHTMASIHCMARAMQAGVKCCLLDEYNAISLIDDKLRIEKEHQYGNYVSLIPYTNEVKGLTLTGFKYPLQKATLRKDTSLGISNEIEDETGSIYFDEGILIVIEARDYR